MIRAVPWLIGAIGIVSLALHLVLISAERAIFLNGLDFTAAGIHVAGDPRDLTRLQADLARYAGAVALLFGLYIWIIVLAGRERLVGRSRMAALAFPVAIHLALLPGRPYLSLDLFSYLAHGAQVVLLGSNPYATAAAELAATDYGRELISLGWRPTIPVTPYGPLWTGVEVGVVAVTRDVGSGILVLKAIAVAASLGSAAVIWVIAGRVRPSLQLIATLAYLWNPLIVGELAGEGHNDAVMILLVLAALYAAVRVRPALTFVALGVSVAAKLLPAILAPPLAVFLLREGRDRAWPARGVIARLAIAVGISGLLFAPYWVGAATFVGVGSVVEKGSTFASTRWALTELAGSAAGGAVQVLLALGFVAVTVAVSARVRDATDMLRACAWIALAYVLVATPYYWPWHATLPVALMALTPRGAFLWLIVALAAGSRLAAPLDGMFANGFISHHTQATLSYVLGIGLPLLMVCATALRDGREARSPRPPIEISRG